MHIRNLFKPAKSATLMRLQIGLILIGIALVIGGNVFALTHLPRYIVNPPSAAVESRHINDQRQACEVAGGNLVLEHLTIWRCTVPYLRPDEPWYHPAKEYTSYMIEQDLLAPLTIIFAIVIGLVAIIVIHSNFHNKMFVIGERQRKAKAVQPTQLGTIP